jgi:hypothetical protein
VPGGPALFFSFYFDREIDGVLMANEDILTWDGADGFDLYFDGTDLGLANFVLDAFAITGPSEILMSFTAAGSVPGLGSVDDSDIVKFTADSLGENTAGSFSLYFDGSDVGLTRSGEDVDAIELLADGTLLISTMSSFSVPGLSGQDEDIIAFTPASLGEATAGAWAMYFDGSDVGLADSHREDVNAVAVDGAGNISLSVIRSFSVAGLTGLDEDVFTCNSPTTGTNTSCSSFTLLFDGDTYGLAFGGNDVFAIDLP